MKKRTILTLVIAIISIMGASTLVYNALTPDSNNYDADSDGSVAEGTGDTFTSETNLSDILTTTDTLTETVIDSATYKTTVAETTSKSTAKTTAAVTTVTPSPAQTTAPQPAVTTTPVKGDAPDFTIFNSNGDAVKLSDYSGKPIVVNFWASWCSPCKSEMPEFQEMYNKYSGQNVIFLMINMTDGRKETTQSAQSFIDSNGYSFTVFFDTNKNAAKAYNISSIPATYFITKDGNIQNKQIGQLSSSALENGIKAIL